MHNYNPCFDSKKKYIIFYSTISILDYDMAVNEDPLTNYQENFHGEVDTKDGAAVNETELVDGPVGFSDPILRSSPALNKSESTDSSDNNTSYESITVNDDVDVKEAAFVQEDHGDKDKPDVLPNIGVDELGNLCENDSKVESFPNDHSVERDETCPLDDQVASSNYLIDTPATDTKEIRDVVEDDPNRDCELTNYLPSDRDMNQHFPASVDTTESPSAQADHYKDQAYEKAPSCPKSNGEEQSFMEFENKADNNPDVSTPGFNEVSVCKQQDFDNSSQLQVQAYDVPAVKSTDDDNSSIMTQDPPGAGQVTPISPNFSQHYSSNTEYDRTMGNNLPNMVAPCPPKTAPAVQTQQHPQQQSNISLPPSQQHCGPSSAMSGGDFGSSSGYETQSNNSCSPYTPDSLNAASYDNNTQNATYLDQQHTGYSQHKNIMPTSASGKFMSTTPCNAMRSAPSNDSGKLHEFIFLLMFF